MKTLFMLLAFSSMSLADQFGGPVGATSIGGSMPCFENASNLNDVYWVIIKKLDKRHYVMLSKPRMGVPQTGILTTKYTTFNYTGRPDIWMKQKDWKTVQGLDGFDKTVAGYEECKTPKEEYIYYGCAGNVTTKEIYEIEPKQIYSPTYGNCPGQRRVERISDK